MDKIKKLEKEENLNILKRTREDLLELKTSYTLNEAREERFDENIKVINDKIKELE